MGLLFKILALALVTQAHSLVVSTNTFGKSAYHLNSKRISSASSSFGLIPSTSFGGSGGGIRLRGGEGGGGGGGGEGPGEGASSDGDSNPVTRLWACYLKLLDDKPLQTRIITGFIIGAIGDIISQISGGCKALSLDIKRLLIFSSWGGIGFTPVGFRWYNLIESTVPTSIPYRFFWKMLMDQSVFPAFMTAVTFVCLTMVEGIFEGVSLTLDGGLRATGAHWRGLYPLLLDGLAKVRKELLPTLITNYKVWPLAQVLNFAVVPIKLQVLFVNLVAVWWNFVLSMTQHS